jgi:hypothetical protein
MDDLSKLCPFAFSFVFVILLSFLFGGVLGVFFFPFLFWGGVVEEIIFGKHECL